MNKISIRGFIVAIAISGSLYLAVVDTTFRPKFAELAAITITGYLSLSIPKEQK